MAKFPLLLLAGAAVCLGGCSTGNKPAPTYTYPTHVPRPTVFYDEGFVDDDPCCAPLDEWMPKLFEPAKPRARLPETAFYP